MTALAEGLTLPELRSLVLQPELAELSRARHFVTSIAEKAGFVEVRVFDIALLTSEAAANAIEHAPVKGQVTITALLYRDRLEIQVAGPGEFQTPDRSREPSTRGLGLPLMAKLSDHLALYSAPEGGTLLTLTFYRDGRPSRRRGSPLPPTLLDMFETGDRLETVFGAMPEGFAIFDNDLRCIYLNDAMIVHDGRPREVLLGACLTSLEHGTTILPSMFEAAKASGKEVTAEAKHPQRETWSEVSVIPFAGGYALFSRDITGRRNGEEAPAESEADERFRVFAENLPGMAWIKDAQGRYVYLSKAHEQRFGLHLEDWLGRTDTDVWPPEIAEEFRRNDRAVLESGEVIRVVEKTIDRNGETAYWLNSKFPFKNAAGEQFVGGVGIDITARIEAEEALREREERFRFLAEENERLYRQQLDIAERLQLALLNIPSEIGRVRVGHLYRSATEAARVGGDFYDVFEVKGGLVVVLVGDVAGHGIEAARTATLVKDVVHAFAHQTVRPQEVLRRTNGLLVEKELPGFVTLFLGILDSETGEFRFASAGHPSMFLRRASGDIQALGTGSSPLGVHADATWKSGAVGLEAGDLLLLYTDGVIEARRNGEYFGEKRLGTLLKRRRISVERLPHTVLDQVLAFSGGNLKDDVAVLALSFAGPAGGRREPAFSQESLPV